MSIISGSLYIIATPIGNLNDLSPRAIDILTNVDLIIAEDTRHSGVLLQKFGINVPIQAYHDHNERQRVPEVIDRLRNKETIALISDAGTPLINDPGYHLVTAAHDAGVRVIPIPGPSALISALCVSGLATDRFVFEGYPPTKKEVRLRCFEALTHQGRTLIFYEAPHRIIQTIDDAIHCFGSDRIAALGKELTKLNETVIRDTLGNIKIWLEADKSRQKGEFVLLIQGAKNAKFDEQEATRILKILLQSVSMKEAVRLATEILCGNRNELYKLAVLLKEEL